MHNWQILNAFKFDPDAQNDFRGILTNLLINRGITGEKQVEAFLNPDLKDLTLENLGINKEAVESASQRIKKAIKDKEKIVIYTDYDADGILSGAILWETLFSQKADIMPFVPDRIKEGYGLSIVGIDSVKSKYNPGLLITVDHGITKASEVDYAIENGMEVIIVDHHLPPVELPKAQSIIHTTVLCATGLAWVFANYLKGKTQENLLDLAAIGTVADLVPLTGANRALVKFGLEKLKVTKRIGLNALFNSIGLKKGEINTFSLSHIIAPRLNASGRLTNALDSLRLICTTDSDRAQQLAEELNSVNRNRQTLTKESTDLAISQVTSSSRIIFTGHESFHQGVIGLIAGKLVENFKRPAIVLSLGTEYCKASVRSVKGVNIVEFLRGASELLIDVGGHPMAAGFTVHRDNLEKLRQKISELGENLITEENLVPEKIIDLELDPGFIDKKLYNEIAALEPFGQGNPMPVFAGFKLSVLSSRLVGKEKNHLKLTLQSEKNPSKMINAIGFNLSEHFQLLSGGAVIDVIYQISKDDWNGPDSLILKLKDVRLSH